MKKIEPWKKLAFVGTLAVIAFLINFQVTRQKSIVLHEQRQKEEAIQQSRQQVETERKEKVETQKAVDDAAAKERKAAQDAAAEFERYLRRYVNAGFSRKAGRKTVALAVVSQNGSFNPTISTALSRRFSGEGAEIYSSFFTPEFVSDGLFTAAFNGSREVTLRLKLADSLDGLLLAYQQVQYSTNAALENLITANVRLEVMTLPIVATGQNQAWTFTANGAGFHTADALLMADERLMKQISADTKMSLSQISQSNRN